MADDIQVQLSKLHDQMIALGKEGKNAADLIAGLKEQFDAGYKNVQLFAFERGMNLSYLANNENPLGGPLQQNWPNMMQRTTMNTMYVMTCSHSGIL